jgi:hypothetical protein
MAWRHAQHVLYADFTEGQLLLPVSGHPQSTEFNPAHLICASPRTNYHRSNCSIL